MNHEKFVLDNIHKIADMRAGIASQLGTDNLAMICDIGTGDIVMMRTRDIPGAFIRASRKNVPPSLKRPFASCNPNFDATPGSPRVWTILVGDGRVNFTRVICPCSSARIVLNHLGSC